MPRYGSYRARSETERYMYWKQDEYRRRQERCIRAALKRLGRKATPGIVRRLYREGLRCNERTGRIYKKN